MAQTRVTAGRWRGRVMVTSGDRTTRPTQAMVREALFNILGEQVGDADLLDLYAGAGTVGFEALSRGAAQVTFVERDRAAVACIRRTAATFACEDRVRVVTADVQRWLIGHPSAPEHFDIAFLDAPYGEDGADLALATLGLRPPRVVVCEHHRARTIGERVGLLDRVRDYTYGSTQLTILRRRADADAAAPAHG